MILTHEVGLCGRGDARFLGQLVHGLTFARLAGAQIVIVRVESPRAVARALAAAPAPAESDPSAGPGWAELLALVRACPLPTLAVVEGPAGPEHTALLSGCDVVLASEEASFAAPTYAPDPSEVDDWAQQARASLERRIAHETVEAWAHDARPRDARWAVGASLVDGIFDDPGVTAGTARCARALAGATPAIRRAIRLRVDVEPLAALRWALPDMDGERASSSPPPELRRVRVPPPHDLAPIKPHEPS